MKVNTEDNVQSERIHQYVTLQYEVTFINAFNIVKFVVFPIILCMYSSPSIKIKTIRIIRHQSSR